MGRCRFYGIFLATCCICFGIFIVVPILGVLWVLSIGDKSDHDLGLWCVLDVGVVAWFFMFDWVKICDNIAFCEGTGLGKGFGYDDEVYLTALVLPVKIGGWLNIIYEKQL